MLPIHGTMCAAEVSCQCNVSKNLEIGPLRNTSCVAQHTEHIQHMNANNTFCVSGQKEVGHEMHALLL